jgi:hypothetical protein
MILSIFYGRREEKSARRISFTRFDGIPVKDPDETWGFRVFSQEPHRIFPNIKQVLAKEIPWLVQL